MHNIEILTHLEVFRDLDCPILLGPSRKSFIGEILNKPPKERDAGTAGVALYAYLKGVHILRVHNVPQVLMPLKLLNSFGKAKTFEIRFYLFNRVLQIFSIYRSF